jgi:hypothetical protein
VAGLATDIYEYVKLEDRFPGQVDQSEKPGVQADDLGTIMAASGKQSFVRQWIWTEKQFPLKTIIDEGPKKTTTETMRISVDVNLPERVFTVPKGYVLKKQH